MVLALHTPSSVWINVQGILRESIKKFKISKVEVNQFEIILLDLLEVDLYGN